MLRSVLLLVFLFASPILFAAKPNDAEMKSAKQTLVDSLKVFDTTVLGSKEQSVIKEVYSVVRVSLVKGSVQFVVDPAERSLLSGIELQNEAQKITVKISISLFRENQRYPGFITSCLSQAIALCRSSLNASTKPYRPDDIQKIFDTMDALYLQALYLKNFDAMRVNKFHPFESYLLESLKTDESLGLAAMSNAAIVLLGVDSQILSSFAEIGGAAKERKLTFDDYMKRMFALVDRLSQSLAASDNKKTDAKVQYIALISALTMLKYGVAIINDHVNRYFPDDLKKQDKLFNSLNTALDKLEKMSQERKLWIQYQASFLKSKSI